MGAIAALVLAVSTPSLAQSNATNESALVRQGLELRAHGHDDEAARVFHQAYDLTHSARAAGLLGVTEQALGRWLDAERHVREALAAPTDSWIVRYRGDLDRSMAVIHEHVGTLEVTGSPVGAEVFVNGERVGTLPLAEPIHLEIGSVAVEARFDGYYALNRVVRISSGGTPSREAVTLTRLPPPPPPVLSAVAAVDTTHLAHTDLRFSPLTIAAWVLGGAGLSAGIASLALWAAPAAAHWNDSRPASAGGCGDTSMNGCTAARDIATAGTWTGSAFLVLGGLASIASVISLVADVRNSRRVAHRSSWLVTPVGAAFTF